MVVLDNSSVRAVRHPNARMSTRSTVESNEESMGMEVVELVDDPIGEGMEETDDDIVQMMKATDIGNGSN